MATYVVQGRVNVEGLPGLTLAPTKVMVGTGWKLKEPGVREAVSEIRRPKANANTASPRRVQSSTCVAAVDIS
jgi:hypothetical protein